MIAIPRSKQRILEALQLRANTIQEELNETNEAWRETLGPLVPEGERLEDYQIVPNGSGLELHKKPPATKAATEAVTEPPITG